MKKTLALGLAAVVAAGAALTAAPQEAKAQFVSVGFGTGFGGGYYGNGFYGNRFYGGGFYRRPFVNRIGFYPAYGYYRPRTVVVTRVVDRPVVYAYPRRVVRRVVYRQPYYRTASRVVYRAPYYSTRFVSRPAYRTNVVYRQPFYRANRVVVRDRFEGRRFARFDGGRRFDRFDGGRRFARFDGGRRFDRVERRASRGDRFVTGSVRGRFAN